MSLYARKLEHAVRGPPVRAWKTIVVAVQPGGALRDGADALAGYVNEVTVHTWDLARATGQAVAWDDEAVGVGIIVIAMFLPMVELIKTLSA